MKLSINEEYDRLVLDYVIDYLEPYEEKELLKPKHWIFKKPIESLKKVKEEKI